MEPYRLVRINCTQLVEPELSAASLAGDLTGDSAGLVKLWFCYGPGQQE